VVIRRLQAESRTGSVRRPKTGGLPTVLRNQPSLRLCSWCVWLQLIDDKKSLSEKCEQLVQELKTVDKKYQDQIKMLEDKLVLTLCRQNA